MFAKNPERCCPSECAMKNTEGGFAGGPHSAVNQPAVRLTSAARSAQTRPKSVKDTSYTPGGLCRDIGLAADAIIGRHVMRSHEPSTGRKKNHDGRNWSRIAAANTTHLGAGLIRGQDLNGWGFVVQHKRTPEVVKEIDVAHLSNRLNNPLWGPSVTSPLHAPILARPDEFTNSGNFTGIAAHSFTVGAREDQRANDFQAQRFDPFFDSLPPCGGDCGEIRTDPFATPACKQ